MVKEKLEKALYNEFMDNPTISSKDREVFVKGGLFGAKWQAERMYSEEELQQKIDAHLEVAKDLWLSAIKEQKRMYSEEEVGELLYNVIGEYGKHYGIMIDGKMLNDLFEQFKK